ncbi:hypothetical protein [Arthrobacter castelli]|uniref:hypothetical protein n=1 Tax=Arthrobacter castelli TaxID=271431 RepID=UPI0003F5A633|nr:hypothetical protein [Arthrobacter castelli]
MDYRYDPIYQRDGADSGHKQQPPVAQPQPEAEPEPVEVSPVTAQGERVPDDGQAHGTPPGAAAGSNPYVLVLMISGLVLIAAGIVSIFAGGQLVNMQMMATSMQTQQSPFQLMTYGQSLITLGPFLLALGVGTLLGVTFLKAQVWQKVNREAAH